VNTKPTPAGVLSQLRRTTALGACLVLLAGCGSSQNWPGASSYVTIGGTVTGLQGTVVLQNAAASDTLSVTVPAGSSPFTFHLSVLSGSAYAVTVAAAGQPSGQHCVVANGTGTANTNVTTIAVTCSPDVTIGGTITGLAGTVTLKDNGGDALATATNGPFTFATLVQYGGNYSVTVANQPAGQQCTVANGIGTTAGNVTNVAISCLPIGAFKLRPLPTIYTTGKAVAYGASRAGGPPAGEIPSDANVLQDLTLMHSAGFNLIRMFGSDAVSDKVLRLAAATFPDMQFHTGIYLEGAPSSCVDAVNTAQIAAGVAQANKYPNVAAVSVGNETSFAANLPVSCLATYIQTVRNQVSQPVTADDDYTFYAGLTNSGEKPDTILSLIDFASIHMYPFSFFNSNPGAWDWQQLATAAGPARATAMMNASLVAAQTAFGKVSGYMYKNSAGTTVSIGASLPIVIGETGWKARQTNGGQAIETYAATPVNAKMYFDLLYGNSATSTPSWQGAANAPLTIFYFEAFDEAWKGTDDGWGLWDASRNARYALCGNPGGGACTNPVYQNAGYFH